MTINEYLTPTAQTFRDGAVFEQGRMVGFYEGAAVCMGLIEMAKMIAARERAKPLLSGDWEGPCGAKKPNDIRKCNLESGHTGAHARISPKGRVIDSWSGRDRSNAE